MFNDCKPEIQNYAMKIMSCVLRNKELQKIYSFVNK